MPTDPRIIHEWTTYPNERDCACAYERCGVCGVIRRTQRCDLHTQQAYGYDASAYYTRPEMGNFAGMIPDNSAQCDELHAASQHIAPLWSHGAAVLDIGAGIGRLAPYVIATGGRYVACEPNPWAVRYMRAAYWRAIRVHPLSFEELHLAKKWDAILCVHTLEHFLAADRQFERMAQMRQETGVIVTCTPDQADIWNPDHYWAFAPDTLSAWADACGCRTVRSWCTEPMARGERYIWTSIRK